ncbi:hypothetical protein LH460_09935 [Laribacter hongkongensis]|uniref:hypothetical protein n=1 Tax=Laribacter hongkongensis TaxID=168471 RepID=UPI001EFDFB83|nr:hypothetical protein [Laribacter hongkongensis]MCG9124988.1 hypothetical protein [Laribacter hongkongensis]
MKRMLLVLLSALSWAMDPALSAPDQQPKKTSQQKAKSHVTCEGKKYCKEMRSCAEACFYLEQCGVKQLDRYRNPCESAGDY